MKSSPVLYLSTVSDIMFDLLMKSFKGYNLVCYVAKNYLSFILSDAYDVIQLIVNNMG